MIQVNGVTKSYGQNDNRITVLNDISLSIPEGSFVTVLGTSGSGKTTLLKCISGIELVDSGEVLYGDTNLCSLSDEERKKFRREHIGMVFQDYDLLSILNVKENILLPLKLNKMTLDEAYFNQIVSTLGINDKLNTSINTLSGGQQQRVAIARALITRPDLICADEPTGNLDRKNTMEVMKLLASIHQEMHTTIFMITHDQTIVEFADMIINIEDGRLEQWK